MTCSPTAGVLGQHAPFPVPATMYGNGGHDNLTGSKAAANRLEGGAGSDKLVGGEASDQLYVGPDGGIAEGHGGDDLIYGGDTGGNGLLGGGNDQIFGGATAGSLWGDAGNDVLTGGSGDEFLEGGLDVDTLVGADGNDQLNGGPGRDRMNGGAGDDVIQAADISPDEIVRGPGVDRVVKDRLDRLAADCEVAPRLRLSGYYVNGYTVGVTLRRFSEPVTGRVIVQRCLVTLGAQLSCTKLERPGNFGSKRFSGKPGDRVKIRIKLDPADARRKLRQPRRNGKERDVYLLVRFRDRDGQVGERGTRLLIKLP